MNLFFQRDDQLALAFTDQHFEDFLALDVHRCLNDKWKECIRKYASPCQEKVYWVPGLHPGVVAKMTPFIAQHVRRLVV